MNKKDFANKDFSKFVVKDVLEANIGNFSTS